MTELPPDVRHRATTVVCTAMRNRQPGSLDLYNAVVDAVAEVLAADRLAPAIDPNGSEVDHDCMFRQLGRVICEKVGTPPNADGLYDLREAGQRVDALKARVENLLAHNAEHRAQVDDLQEWNERLEGDRDALKARVAEQEIAFAEKLAGVTDASTRHVKQLSERVDLLTTALTGIGEELDNPFDRVREGIAPLLANARAALSATPTATGGCRFCGEPESDTVWCCDERMEADGPTGSEFDSNDLRVSYYYEPGATTLSEFMCGVNITHVPTGITISHHSERSQLQNKVRCYEDLKRRLAGLAPSERGATPTESEAP